MLLALSCPTLSRALPTRVRRSTIECRILASVRCSLGPIHRPAWKGQVPPRQRVPVCRRIRPIVGRSEQPISARCACGDLSDRCLLQPFRSGSQVMSRPPSGPAVCDSTGAEAWLRDMAQRYAADPAVEAITITGSHAPNAAIASWPSPATSLSSGRSCQPARPVQHCQRD